MNFHKQLIGRLYHISLFAILLAVFGASASAQTLYTNGPANGQIDAFTINNGFEVSDSFILSGPDTVSGAQITVWENPGDAMTSLDWAIGTSAFDTSIGSGTGTTVTGPIQLNNEFGYDIATVDFSLGGLSLGPGTYWLSLQNASVNGVDPNNSDGIYWDENNGPSAAIHNTLGNLNTFSDCASGGPFDGGTCSESFQVYGPNGPSSVPEPGTLSLLGTGLFFLLPLSRRLRMKS